MTYKECYCNGEVLYAENLNSDRNALKSGIKQGLQSGINSLRNNVYAVCSFSQVLCAGQTYPISNSYDDAVIDVYYDADGYSGTINTGNTTANYMCSTDFYRCLYHPFQRYCRSEGFYINYSCTGDAISNQCISNQSCGCGACSRCDYVCAESCASVGTWLGCAVDVSSAQLIIFDVEYCGFGACSRSSLLCFTVNGQGFAKTATAKNCGGHTSIIYEKDTGCTWNLYCNGAYKCQQDFTANLICQCMYTCTNAGGCACAYICLQQSILADYSSAVIEIDEQSFATTTNAIYPMVEIPYGDKSDITIDVEDGSSNNLVCDGNIEDFSNFSTACDEVLVKYKLGDSDLKFVKAHGYKVITL